ncbi:MAG: transcription termination factor NusA [Ruminococcus sp.]|jgi:N utilization substance protein A|nr:transcription termination factor NusA [Ruminococcus sp.]
MGKVTKAATDTRLEMFSALEALADSYGIPLEELCTKIEGGLLAAVKKEYPDCETEDFAVKVSPSENIFDVSLLRTVVPDEPTYINEINIDEAHALGFKDAVEGQRIAYRLPIEKFGRVAAMQAKQSLRRDIKEYEKEKLLALFSDKEHTIISAIINTVDYNTGAATLSVEGTEVYLPRSEQIPGERLMPGHPIQVYVIGIVNPEKKPSVKISRTHKDFIRCLFERDIPEVNDGTVEIKSISREAGIMSKVAVWSNNPEVDAIGTCIGPKSSRIGGIVNELRGERIDLIEYIDDPALFIANALSPAEVTEVNILEPVGDELSSEVIVPAAQLSLAIGKKGINAKLAARLTGYKIDIHSENENEA